RADINDPRHQAEGQVANALRLSAIPLHRDAYAVEACRSDGAEVIGLDLITPVAFVRRFKRVSKVHAAPHRERRRLWLAASGAARGERGGAQECLAAIHRLQLKPFPR